MTDVDEAGAGPRWLSPEEQSAWRAYLHGTRLLERALDADIAAHGLSLPEYEILSMLSEAAEGCMRMSSLADLVVQSRSRVTHTAARLEDRGLIQRQRSAHDGRGVEVLLTDAGWDLIGPASRAHVESVRAHLLDLLTADQFRALGEAMSIIQRHGRRRQ